MDYCGAIRENDLYFRVYPRNKTQAEQNGKLYLEIKYTVRLDKPLSYFQYLFLWYSPKTGFYADF